MIGNFTRFPLKGKESRPYSSEVYSCRSGKIAAILVKPSQGCITAMQLKPRRSGAWKSKSPVCEGSQQCQSKHPGEEWWADVPRI